MTNLKLKTSSLKTNWVFEITPERSKFKLNFREIYQYRDLLFLFIRRDIVSIYKQTILGPLWYFISPLMTSLTQYWVFTISRITIRWCALFLVCTKWKCAMELFLLFVEWYLKYFFSQSGHFWKSVFS